jgi:hypothetical protein
MPTILKTKNSVTTTVVPTTLQQGELAVNITDKKLWVGNAATTPVQLLGAGVTGDVVGPASATDNAISRFDGTTGKLIQNSLVTVSDTGAISAPVDASISGLTVGKGGGSLVGNTAVGLSALPASNTGTGFNTAVGYLSMSNNTSGQENTAVGVYSLPSNTTGSYNVAIGRTAVSTNTTGSNNVGVGYQSLNSNTTASYNTAVGSQSAYSNTTGANNVALGYQAVYSNTTGNGLIGIGYGTLRTNTTGSGNTAVGSFDGTALPAMYYNTTGNANSAFGDGALSNNTTASFNTAVGYQAGYSNTTGRIEAFGYAALAANTTGANNTAIGGAALNANTTGGNNVALGLQALVSNTTASDNTAVGYQAAYSTTTGTGITAIGNSAGYSTTGNYNTFVGVTAGYAATTGILNNFFGYGAGSVMTTGGKNTIVGSFNGNQGGLDIRTTSNRIVLSDGDGNPRAYSDNSGNWIISAGTLKINKGLAYQETVSIANNATYDFVIPIDHGVFAVTIPDAGQVTALFTAKLAGGSNGCYVLSQAAAGGFAFGTSSEPAGGTYGRLWNSSAGVIRLKNVGGSTFTFGISIIVYGGA